MSINDVVLNFYIPSYNPTRNMQFRIILFSVQDQTQVELGSFTINTNSYITSFLEQNTILYKQISNFNESLSIQYNLYVQKSKANIISFIKKNPQSIRRQRSKSKKLSIKKSKKKPNEENEQIIQPTPNKRKQFIRAFTLSKDFNQQDIPAPSRDISQSSQIYLIDNNENEKKSLVQLSSIKRVASQKKNEPISLGKLNDAKDQIFQKKLNYKKKQSQKTKNLDFKTNIEQNFERLKQKYLIKQQQKIMKHNQNQQQQIQIKKLTSSKKYNNQISGCSLIKIFLIIMLISFIFYNFTSTKQLKKKQKFKKNPKRHK